MFVSHCKTLENETILSKELITKIKKDFEWSCEYFFDTHKVVFERTSKEFSNLTFYFIGEDHKSETCRNFNKSFILSMANSGKYIKLFFESVPSLDKTEIKKNSFVRRGVG
jgi:hypothetical protein